MRHAYFEAQCIPCKTRRSIVSTLGICAAVFAITSSSSATPVLGSATSSDGSARLDIVSLKRTEGETVTLRFQVTNNGSETFGVTAANSRLIDMVGRRIYSPGLTSSKCSVPVGGQLTCYAVFGAPPLGTQKMSVKFFEDLDLITGIPLSEQ